MNVVLFGATGMLGQAVLLECLEDPVVTAVLSVGRRPTAVQHTKLTEILHDDFTDYSRIADRLSGVDACFFCLGVSSMGMTEAGYREVTYDFTLAAARFLAAHNPGLVFCYVSADGADSTEQSRMMWARVRGQTENDLQKVPMAGVYVLRPGYVHPMKGISPRGWLRHAYGLLRPLYPLLASVLPRHVTTSENIGRAMIRVAQNGYLLPVLESDAINRVAGR